MLGWLVGNRLLCQEDCHLALPHWKSTSGSKVGVGVGRGKLGRGWRASCCSRKVKVLHSLSPALT